MLNKAILMGRLTRDPELRYTQTNIPVVSFSLAVERSRVGQGQERQTDFIDVVAWRHTAEFVSKWFSKGKMAVVVGSIQSRRWQDKDGNNRTSIEVIADEVMFGESKRAGGDSASKPSTADTDRHQQTHQQASTEYDDYTEIDDGDVPF